MDVDDIETLTTTSSPAKELQHLPNSNYQLTSGTTNPTLLTDHDIISTIPTLDSQCDATTNTSRKCKQAEYDTGHRKQQKT